MQIEFLLLISFMLYSEKQFKDISCISILFAFRESLPGGILFGNIPFKTPMVTLGFCMELQYHSIQRGLLQLDSQCSPCLPSKKIKKGELWNILINFKTFLFRQTKCAPLLFCNEIAAYTLNGNKLLLPCLKIMIMAF